MANKKHLFIKKYESGFWLVKCLNVDGGEFNTECWETGKVPVQTCPCCKEVISKK
jgi:hypothetical protein